MAAARDAMTEVEVPGGTLAAFAWGDSGPAVLALHGVTSNHLAWAPVARRLEGMRVIAPDLRGRGRSGGVGAPFGMARHADDAVAALDALGVDRAIVAGHSMGGFVALAVAVRHPERVAGLVLVDGGLPLPVRGDLDPDAALEAVIGPAAQRLAMTWPAREAHVEFWRAHPAMREWNEDIERYVDYDLVGSEPQLRSSCSIDAVRADTLDMADGGVPDGGLELLADVGGPLAPVPFLRAETGMLGEQPALYPSGVAAEWARRLRAVDLRTVPGTNHYTILLAPAGAAAVADVLREAAEATPRAAA